MISSLRKILRSTPFQLLLCIIFASFFGTSLPTSWVRGAYTLSLFFIDTVLLILPIMIFSYMFNALIAVDEKGPVLVFSLLALICISNAVALCVAYGVGSAVIPHLAVNVVMAEIPTSIFPFFRMTLKDGMRSDYVALTAFALSYLCVKAKPKFPSVKYPILAIEKLQTYITLFLKRAFLPILPLYVLGFMLKMNAEGTLSFLYTKYLPIFALNVGVSFLYILLFYKIVSIGYRPMKELIINMLPAGFTGFSTMSGAVTMPVTLECTEKNAKNPVLHKMVIPTTSNMHMLGDDITITLTALTLMMVSGTTFPTFWEFLPYVLGFCIAKLSCVGIAGASLLVVLPVLKEQLGFSSDMVSMITTLYVLQDAFGTFHNVMGNGAFALIVEKTFTKFKLIS